jgi:hypothetical protein
LSITDTVENKPAVSHSGADIEVLDHEGNMSVPRLHNSQSLFLKTATRGPLILLSTGIVNLHQNCGSGSDNGSARSETGNFFYYKGQENNLQIRHRSLNK